LLVAGRSDGRIRHTRFAGLPSLLDPGDLLVVNLSVTIPAAIAARSATGAELRVHFSTRAPGLGPSWRVVELRTGNGGCPRRGRAGERVLLRGGETLELVAPYASGARLLLARFLGQGSIDEYLAEFGEPIRYGYVHHGWPLDAYQNVYATRPGSAEMPSAGRPFTTELITKLLERGVLFAPITLHTGVSSPERHEPPFPEQFEVPPATARLIDTVRGRGGRVIAVGTTVVRALETVAQADGTVVGGAGWTTVVIDPGRGVTTIDGLITGWHEPQASHLQMLEAIAGRELLARCYQEALGRGYLWHEFGDSHLIL
jgi:S-adenosylmethionine:tRNA ribosyltransferase-isomerase